MSYNYSFSDVNESDLALMRPGIIYALDNYSDNPVEANKIDSRSENKRIGRVLGALYSAGLIEEYRRTGNSYEYSINASLDPEKDEKSLNLALGEARERFDNTIKKGLNRQGRDENIVVEEILTHGVYMDTQRDTDIFRRLREYSDETVNFLNDINMIKNLEDSKIVADDEDIEYMQKNIHLFL